MKFHNITTNDMLNGEGLRVVLWVSGCELHCKGCQNPETWDPECGVEFDKEVKEELFSYLEKPEISGLTLSGGHPLHEKNLETIMELIQEVKEKFPEKTIWLYTGYTLEDIVLDYYKDGSITTVKRFKIIEDVDVLCDGRYIQSLNSSEKHWVGSENQRVIDIEPTIKKFFMDMGNQNLLEIAISEEKYWDTIEYTIGSSIILHDDNKVIKY